MRQDRSTVYSDGAVRLLPVAFLIVIGGFVLGNLLALVSARRTQAINREISQNAIISSDDINRIVHDIDLIRLMTNEHIFETSIQKMDPLERQIKQVESGLSAVAHQYDPLTTFPREHKIWEKLRQQVGDLQQPLNEVLQLSRRNRDIEARQAMGAIETRFDDINQRAEKLLRINRDAAQNAVVEIQALQRRALMLHAVATVLGTLSGLFVSVWVIRILRQRDHQIKQASLLLESKNQELDAFAGRVAHDLREPLSAMNLATVNLSKYVAENDNAIAVLRRGVGRMDALIHDLLALSRVEAVGPSTATNTTTVATTLEEDLLPSVNSVNGVLLADVESADVRCSDTLLRQVLWNIGENALKYRRPNTRLEILIQGRTARDSYEFRIFDNGAGMSAEDAAHVFDPFFRATKVRSIPGTGLGLSIVKRIVEASGGTVSVTSELGKGTTFLLSLPLVRQAGE